MNENDTPNDILGLLGQLGTMRTGNRTLELLEEIAENRDNPEYEPPTFGELFGSEDGLNVFGEILPGDIEGLADEPVSYEWLKGPLRAMEVNKRRLAKAAEQMQKAQDDFAKRAKRRAKAKVRKTPGGTKRVREFLQTLGVRDLDLFAAGTARNRLVFGKRTTIHLGVTAPRQVMDVSTELSVAEVKGALDREVYHTFVSDQIDGIDALVLDHSEMIGVAIASAAGHDRVDRDIQIRFAFRDGADLYAATRRGSNGRNQGIQQDVPLTDEEQEILNNAEDGTAIATVTLDYSFKVARNKVNPTLEMLQFVSGQPVFRGISLASEDEEDTLDAGTAPTSLDEMLQDGFAIAEELHGDDEEDETTAEELPDFEPNPRRAVAEEEPAEESEEEPTEQDLEAISDFDLNNLTDEGGEDTTEDAAETTYVEPVPQDDGDDFDDLLNFG